MILEEGNQTCPSCPKCDIFLLHKSLNICHLTTAFCRQGEERKRLCLAEEEARAGAEAAIIFYGIPLAPITPFKYFRRVISVADKDWPAVVRNLQRAWQKWARLTRLLSREGADARTLGHIYLAVVQSFMVYGP